MEGWLSVKGKCYQEFTPVPELCPGENEILRLKKPNVLWLSPPDEENIEMKLKYGFTCEMNICSSGSLPHSDTWEDRKCHEVPPDGNLGNCELAVAWNAQNDNPPLKCCFPSSRSICSPVNGVENFSAVIPTNQASCKNHCYWSAIQKRCVKRRRRQKKKCY